MLNITKQSDYGLLFISFLMGKDTYVPLSELIKETKLPPRFLARTAAELVKHGIVKSKEGKIGGYILSKKAKEMSLYDYLRIFEGELNLTKCSNPNYHCVWEYMCVHKSFLRHKLHDIVREELKNWKIKDLFNSGLN